MTDYILRRLLLLPLTLFCIVLVTFVIINLAPGDPVTITEIGPEGGATRQADRAFAFGSDARYLQFREHYGLTLPVLFNLWPLTSFEQVKESLKQLVERDEAGSVKSYDALRVAFGDRARFIMPKLLKIMEDPDASPEMRRMAARFFVRGGTRQAILGANLTEEQRRYNRKVSQENLWLRRQLETGEWGPFRRWYEKNKAFYRFEPTGWEKAGIFFTGTRFFRYLSRVATLDFGTMRNDPNKTVISEVAKRFKYSLTLSILPMFLTFFSCLFFGFVMALNQNRLPDLALNLTFLILYAIPVFVVAPFLIEKVAVKGYFPLSGFTSPEAVYETQLSYQRFLDVLYHIFLPLVAIMYGTLAVQSRLSRTAVLEVMRQDYVRTAEAKGVPKGAVWGKHIGRNAAITIVTSIAASLGVVLGGSLIVETLFEIDGFGKFFYDAIINRDYNVIMFSALAGAFLTLCGYLAADVAYMLLDPRVTLD